MNADIPSPDPPPNELRAFLERSRQQFREGQWLSEEDFWAQFERLAGGDPRSLRSISEEAHRQFEEGRGIPEDQFWRQVEESRRTKRPPASRGKKP